MSALRPDATLEKFRHRGDGRLPGLIGVRFTGVAERRIDAELDIRPELLAPNGYLHAATVIALADTACGYGCLAHLPEGAENFTTIELKSNFVGTAREGTLACVATPVHLGSTTQVWDAVVTDRSRDRRIALFRCTQLVLWPSARRSPSS
ncbi:MAG TPA: PaaI family thioesterase [Casimicrobiaceae bacterium]|nr:PaaI family thioesterase [Casimicrobiaceae bacterium]